MRSDLEIIKSVFISVDSGFSDINRVVQELVELECPLPGVIFLKNAELTKLMLDRGCSVADRLPQSNETALHIAVEFSDIHNLKVLFEHGADVNATDSKNCTPLDRFQMRSHDKDEKLNILRLLLDRGALFGDEPAMLRRILSNGDIRTIRVLMPYIDLFPNNENGFYPLHDLVENKHDGIFELLQGKTFDANDRDDDGWTLLDRAVMRHCASTVQFLLENGADPNTIDDYGSMPLYFHVSEMPQDPEVDIRICELLLQYGANAQNLWKDSFPILVKDIEDTFVLMKPVLAHLAMIDSFGEPLHKNVCDGIEVVQMYKDYFESCKLQIQLMKNTIMCESVTLHSLLRESRKNIAIYSRNQEFVSNYELFVTNDKCNLNQYYFSTIHLRVDKTLNLVQAKEKVACFVCQIMNLPYSMIDTIGHEVVKYLQYDDLEQVLQV